MTPGFPFRATLGALAVCVAACGGQTVEPPDAGEVQARVSSTDDTADLPGVDDADLPIAPLERMQVTVFFPSALDSGLRGETREIFDTASPVERAKQIISDLLAGPGEEESLGALPRGTRLRQVFVIDEGVAFVDFSSEIRDGMSGGSHNEVLAVYAVVNSLALNIPEIDRVAILINGRPCETLNGHVDLRRPLRADPSLEAREARVVL